METIPLLSPSMETELLKEPWVFPSTKTSPPKEEDTTVFSVWEENFQDLSGWCKDTFQGQCDFPIGESTSLKLSGTKYEGNGVSTSEQGVSKDIKRITDDEKWSLKMEAVGIPKNLGNSGGVTATLLHASPPSSKHKEEHGNAECSTSSASSLKVPGSATAATHATTWSKQNGTDVSAPFSPVYHVSYHDLDDGCPTSFDSAECQRETWDMLRTVETTGSDTFDLLSYLCDDDMRSPEGSTSMDSTVTSKLRTTTSSSSAITEESTKPKTAKKTETPRRRTETRATSSTTSSLPETPAVLPSRRSERTRNATTYKIENYVAEKRESRGKKRYVDSDSDDRMSSTSSYRESREKNNEASRKSRMNKKAKETEMAVRAVELERDNRILKMKVEELEKLVTSMRNALLQSALKKEF